MTAREILYRLQKGGKPWQHITTKTHSSMGSTPAGTMISADPQSDGGTGG